MRKLTKGDEAHLDVTRVAGESRLVDRQGAGLMGTR